MLNQDAKDGVVDTLQLPSSGLNSEQILDILEKRMSEGHVDWKSGKVSGAVYAWNEDRIKLVNQAINIYNVTNPLHPDVFPGLRRLDAEIVSMVLDMYNAPANGCGTTTSGGTESILMTVRAHHLKAQKERGVKYPNLIAPTTIHTAFDKACDYFGIQLIHIPIDPVSGKVNLNILQKAINSQTIMIAGSAINYPHGVMDDIEAMASIAESRGIGMHVDCCLGSFLMPFMKDAGFTVPLFDFRLTGYGFAPKGSSVIMYSNKNLRQYQYFVSTEWPGGIYASPTIAGSRPGSLIAGCWAAMTSIGRDGIESIEGLEIIGDPICSVVAFSSNGPINIYAIHDAMTSRGWGLSALQRPPALHIACTGLTVGAEDLLLQDLKSSIAEIEANPERFSKGSSAMYGMAVSLPDQAPVQEITRGYLDALYST
ncbi:Sphingosine-1-phosphate lyase [Smittium mucronatum]|uniref:sphinganine-1-phosphate aldolase n=1 Tax=Smittium mucronatum TaxID=133383 RepID=A0A1R0GW46_9FUNG|nr:Sphingosine-1-phosphate lyase [Smittium mucronatum]